MRLLQLSVEHLRNLRTCSFQPHPNLNLIAGPNGSGKTSILEAIYLLGRAKSFRDSQTSNAIAVGQPSSRLFASVSTAKGESGGTRRIGMELSREGRRTIRVDGVTINRSSDLADVLPLTYIGLEETRLLADSPQQRRRFLDWGLFHVEQSYRGALQRYERALKQRNAILRDRRSATRPRDVAVWDTQLAEDASVLIAMRTHYLEALLPVFQRYWEQLTNLQPHEMVLVYQPGCPREPIEFKDLLTENLRRDGERGYTQHGPHRCDFMVYRGAQSVSHFASAGEQKAAVCALHLAQWDVFRSRVGTAPVLLIDDLPAELDSKRRQRFADLISALGCQAFITATEAELLTGAIDPHNPEFGQMFHVEHGELQP